MWDEWVGAPTVDAKAAFVVLTRGESSDTLLRHTRSSLPHWRGADRCWIPWEQAAFIYRAPKQSFGMIAQGPSGFLALTAVRLSARRRYPWIGIGTVRKPCQWDSRYWPSSYCARSRWPIRRTVRRQAPRIQRPHINPRRLRAHRRKRHIPEAVRALRAPTLQVATTAPAAPTT